MRSRMMIGRSLLYTSSIKQKSWVPIADNLSQPNYAATDLSYTMNAEESGIFENVSGTSIDTLRSSQLNDLDFDEEGYLNDFEKFSQSNITHDSLNKAIAIQKDKNFEIHEEKFDDELKERGENTMFEAIKGIDKSNALKMLIKKTKLSELSGEIMKIAGFVKAMPLLKKEKKDAAMVFLISLDYLVKGLFTHWQITLMDESKKTKHSAIRRKMQKEALIMQNDIKFNILIGDQFHAKAYYLTTRLGNNELSNILTRIEENFAKIIFRDGYNG